jgi:hypothetical protein
MCLTGTETAMATTQPPASLADVPPTALLGEVEAILAEVVTGLTPVVDQDRAPHSPGRPPILPAFLVWGTLLVGVVRGLRSQADCFRLLGVGLWGHAPVEVSDQALRHRWARAGTGPMEQCFVAVSALVRARLEPLRASWGGATLAPFASDVVVLDETTLDQVARSLPALRGVPAGDDRLLPGKLAGVFDVRRQSWRVLRWIEAVHQNEKVVARELLADLAAGSLIMTDLGYFGFQWFDDLTDAGHWWLSRLRAKTSTVVLHTFITTDTYRDQLVWLGAYRADRAKHAVRLVEVKVGGHWHRYITNQLDPVVFPAAEVVALYARRWDIELAIRLVKDHLGLGLLWSANPVLIQQQVWAVLSIAQILQGLRLEIAARAEVEPFDVSMELLVRWVPRLAAAGRDWLTIVVDDGRRLGFIRPSRRRQLELPEVAPDDLLPLPPDLLRIRTPRYAQRNGGPRSQAVA